MKERKKKFSQVASAAILSVILLILFVLIIGVNYLPLKALSGDFDEKTQRYADLAAVTPKGGTVFFGDSITEMYDLDAYFPDRGFINRGISGDYTTHLLERLKSSVIDIVPSRVVFLAGANDIGRDISPEESQDNFGAIFDAIHDALPDCEILVQSIYPIYPKRAILSKKVIGKRDNGKVERLNIRLKSVCDARGITYIDVHSELIKDGVLNPDYTIEGLHLNAEGYRAVTAVLNSYL